ncbi:MAG: lipopolysaccharide assembly protein LapB [Pseudomonadota bacterium]
MIDFLWLLLPIAAASGWLAARRKERQGTTKFSLSTDDFKGLNHQLNEEPDKVIDIFINQILLDKETVETLLDLGIFFRRNGEINRAIRIHQNLINRSTPQQRNKALFELAQDYRYAGLLDRAEHLFQKLSTSDSHKALALRQLLALYQQEHDWKKAIRTAQKTQKTQKLAEAMHTEIAQYYCEQAEEYQQQGQSEAAQQAIQNALKADPNCVRASLLEGQLALEKGEPKRAILAFQRVEQQDPDYITEIITPLQSCYQEIGQQQEFTQYLRHLLEHHGCIRPMLALANTIKPQDENQQLFDFIVKKIQTQRPSVAGLDLLLDLALKDNISRAHLLLLKEMTTQLLKNKPAYKCTHCGLTARKLYWQCPSCQQWNTVKPL